MPDLTPDTPSVVAEPAQSKVGSDAFQRLPVSGIGEGLQQFGAGLEDMAVPFAKMQATQDVAAIKAATAPNGTVMRNPDGTPFSLPIASNLIFGRAGEAAHDVLQTGAMNQAQAQVSQRLSELHNQYPTDPQGFLKAANQYAGQLQDSYAPVIGDQGAAGLSALAMREGAQRFGSLLQTNTVRNVEMDKQSLLSTITDQQNDMRNLARTGGMDSDDFKARQVALLANYAKLKGNPLYGVSAATADSQLATEQSMFQVEHVLGQVESVFHRGGGDGGRSAAQQFLIKNIRDNPDLHIGPEEKDKLVNYGATHIDYMTSEFKAKIDASRLTTDKAVAALASPDDMDPSAGYRALELAKSVGDTEQMLKIQAYMDARSQAGSWKGLTDEQRLLAASHQDYISKTGMQESGGRDVPPTGNGGGRFQINDDTWNGVAANHPELGLPQAGNGAKPQQDPAQSYKAMLALTKDNQAGLVSAGIAPTDSNTSMAHFLGLGGATSFLRAMATNSDAPAAASNLKAATANPSVFYKPGADGKPDPAQPRSLREVYDLRTQRFGGLNGPTTPVVAPGTGGAPTPAQMQANPFALAAYLDVTRRDAGQTETAAKSVGESLITQLASANAPPPGTVAAYLQVGLRYPGMAEQVQKVGNQLAAFQRDQHALGMPTTAQGQSYVDQVATTLQSGIDLNSMAQGEALKSMWNKGVERLKSDPHVEAYARHWTQQLPGPLDFGDAGTKDQPGSTSTDVLGRLWPGVTARVASATAIASHTGNLDTPMFEPKALQAVKSIAADGTLAQKFGLAEAISAPGIPQNVLKATLAQLGASKETRPLVAAGFLLKENPTAANAVLDGAHLMQTEPKLAPNRDDFAGEFAKRLPFNDLGPGQARDVFDTAVQALYAKATADAGDDLTGTPVINQARLDKAIDDATGGVVTYRGSHAIAPWYQAGQSGLDAALRTLTDADFKGAHTMNGEAFPASAIKPSFSSNFFGQGWRLESTGDGKYLVFSGSEEAGKRNYLVEGANRQPFVLDLGAKRTQAEQSMAGGLARSGYDIFTQTIPALN